MKPDYTKLPPECDALCEFRNCLHKGENKGSFTVGKGYTNYYDNPIYVCVTRMYHGCPNSRNEGIAGIDLKKLDNYIENITADLKCSKKVKVVMNKLKNYISMFIKNEICRRSN